MTKKILSLILALLICFTSVPMAFATEETTTQPSDIYDISGEVTEETTTTEPTLTEEETTTEASVSEETTTEPTAPEEETTTEPSVPEEETTTEPTAPEEETTEPTVPDEPQVPDTPEEPVYDENEVVANFYVFLIESLPHPIGHTWVYIENLTDRELQVGLYTLPPHEGVSVGVLARPDGWGIYYNVESYAQNTHGMGKHISMSDPLTAKQLKKVSKTIINYVNHWDPIFNCMYFAFKVWNSGSRRILLPLLFPVVGKLQMAIYRHEMNAEMKPVRRDQCFKQVGFGKFAYLKEISDRSLTVV
jgi:hypothetical protein